jgi:pimeloyl-ACP methyl ester carboxylesterase
MAGAPIVLVPGWWLGAWAWDEVAVLLRNDGHEVTAVTLPGLDSVDTDRSAVTFEDHVEAICAAVVGLDRPVVLAVHSGAGFPGYAATDRCPENIAHMVYVDTGPGVGAADAEFQGVEMPMSMDNLEANENLDGISDERKAEPRAGSPRERPKEHSAGSDNVSSESSNPKARGASEKSRAAPAKRSDREESKSTRTAKKSDKGQVDVRVLSREQAGEARTALRMASKDEAKGRDGKGIDAKIKVEKVDASDLDQGGYEGLVRSWHAPWPAHAGDQAVDLIANAAPVLSVHPVGKASTPYVLLPNGKDGGFNEAQIAVASQAFGNWPGGPQVSARLLDLIYHAALHFKVFHVHLVSGIRNDRSGSRHSHGLAADIVFPGVSDEELASYFRPQGFLGVGIYTIAGFVHVDIREKSYFWLDKSPPGRRTKVVPIRMEEARLADEAALQRGQNGYVNPPRLQKALHARAKRRMEKARASQ